MTEVQVLPVDKVEVKSHKITWSNRWIGVHGKAPGLTRLLINGKPTDSSRNWRHGRYWFHARFGPGLYLILAESKSIRSSLTWVLSLPAPGGVPPLRYDLETFKKIRLSEALDLGRRLITFILYLYPDTSDIFIVGGLVDRGETERDIDLLVCSKKLYLEEGSHAFKLEYALEDCIGYPLSIFVCEDLSSCIEPGKGAIRIYPHLIKSPQGNPRLQPWEELRNTQIHLLPPVTLEKTALKALQCGRDVQTSNKAFDRKR